MKELTKAKELLLSGGYTCVLCREEDTCFFTKRGVKPLVMLVEDEKDYKDYAAADKVVGKATAFLYVLLGVKAVYAKVISKSAFEVLNDHGIYCQYDEMSKNIINRKGDGICPFEAAVLDIDDAAAAYKVIRQKMNEMSNEPI